MIDTDVRRQLQFQAQYDVSCMLISSDVARNLLKSTAGSNYQHIKEICGQGKKFTIAVIE